MRTRRHLDGGARRSARAGWTLLLTKRRARSDAPCQAFTLIEILIAVAAFAIVLAAINTIFYTALRLRNSTTAAIEKGLPLEHAFSVIKRDLSGLVVPGTTIFGAFSTVATSNNVSGQVGPNFHTTTGVIDEVSPFAEVQRVSYLLVASTNQSNGRDLYRVASRNLLPTLQDLAEQEWLLGGVEAVTFLYHDGSQWRESWDGSVVNTTTGLSNGLPAAVKMQIQLANEDGALRRSSRSRELPVELIVPIQVQQRTNQTQQTMTTTAPAGGEQ